jgi:hypothetical protein
MDLPNSAEHYKVLDCDDYQFNYLSNVLLTSFAPHLISIKHIYRYSKQKKSDQPSTNQYLYYSPKRLVEFNLVTFYLFYLHEEIVQC